ncbi:hypothetical protein BUALT_Bualt03G0125300 [Buddleja alternifolia]|uniref:Uncharacterized protein n=1 Tax=Buddleja alternifolia TaxID=168488 RepID=A0AAV6XXH3_9LAMI|nr:hypothetical protein BUALT_Bualt03G0125300 [Buddleja alternifolia]
MNSMKGVDGFTVQTSQDRIRIKGEEPGSILKDEIERLIKEGKLKEFIVKFAGEEGARKCGDNKGRHRPPKKPDPLTLSKAKIMNNFRDIPEMIEEARKRTRVEERKVERMEHKSIELFPGDKDKTTLIGSQLSPSLEMLTIEKFAP